MQESIGVGVVGLHERRTVLVALNHNVPATVGLATDSIRGVHSVHAVASCESWV